MRVSVLTESPRVSWEQKRKLNSPLNHESLKVCTETLIVPQEVGAEIRIRDLPGDAPFKFNVMLLSNCLCHTDAFYCVAFKEVLKRALW